MGDRFTLTSFRPVGTRERYAVLRVKTETSRRQRIGVHMAALHCIGGLVIFSGTNRFRIPLRGEWNQGTNTGWIEYD